MKKAPLIIALVLCLVIIAGCIMLKMRVTYITERRQDITDLINIDQACQRMYMYNMNRYLDSTAKYMDAEHHQYIKLAIYQFKVDSASRAYNQLHADIDSLHTELINLTK